jgi:outer membrane biosynthesis protein TonB
VRIGGAIVDAPLLDYVEPARPSGIMSGSVIVEVTIGADGRAVEVKPLRGPPELAEVASNAIRKWRFARSCLDGRPIPLIKAIALRYDVPSSSAP